MRKYMKNYQEWYGHVASNIKNKPFLLSLLRTFNRFMTVVMPMIYLTLLAITYGKVKLTRFEEIFEEYCLQASTCLLV